MDPKFVFFGNAKNSIITWKQLRTGHYDGKFNKLIRRKLSKVLATPTERLVLVIHGFGQNIHADSCSDWPAEMAVKIRNYENRLAAGSTAAAAVCWNSGRVPGSADQETGENKNEFRNIKGSRDIKHHENSLEKIVLVLPPIFFQCEAMVCLSIFPQHLHQLICQASFRNPTGYMRYYSHACSTASMGELLAAVVSAVGLVSNVKVGFKV